MTKLISRSLVAAWLFLAGAWTLAQNAPGSAKQQFSELRRALREARDNNDWVTYLRQAGELKNLLNGSPGSLLELARADLKLGRLTEARAEAQHVLDMGQAVDALLAAPFDALHDLAKGVAANRTAVSQGSLAWELSDKALLPEDVDYDSTTHRFFLTSVLQKKIVVLDAVGKIRDFARSPDAWPMLALKIDATHRRLWATQVALENFSIVPKPDWGRSALLCYDLDSGKLLLKIEGPQPSAMGDMVLTKDGIPIVSDGAGGGIYRLRDNKILERLDAGDFISPQTPTLDADGKHILVPDYVRGVGILDLSTRQLRWLAMDNKFALAGTDGLYFHRNTLLAVQNGTSPERVAAFTLDASGQNVVSQKLFESATRTLGDPTHGVIVGSDFYYIANSGWDTLDEHGDRKPDAKPTPARIMRVALTN